MGTFPISLFKLHTCTQIYDFLQYLILSRTVNCLFSVDDIQICQYVKILKEILYLLGTGRDFSKYHTVKEYERIIFISTSVQVLQRHNNQVDSNDMVVLYFC